jgi:hypothetical protein
MLGQVHRTLGLVVFIGKNDESDARGHFAAALAADPAIQLDEDLATREVRAIFDDVKSSRAEAARAPDDEGPVAGAAGQPDGESPHLPGNPPPVERADPADCPPGLPGCPDAAGPDAPAPETSKKRTSNWVLLSVQQDLLLIGSAQRACSEGSSFACFDDSGTYYDRNPYDRQGGDVSSGPNVATTRVLAGYDRAIIGGLALGLRVGLAFRGGPKTPGGRAFMPLHAEGRVAWWFGGFEPRKGPRFFVALGGGLAQVDGRVSVSVYDTEQDYKNDKRTTFDAWKKAGTGFASFGAGALLGLTPNSGVLVEMRVMEMFGGWATVLAPQLGYSLGF